MNDNNSRIADSLGRISLYFAALSVLSASAVVVMSDLIPAWISWGVTLGGGLMALIGAVTSLGLRMILTPQGTIDTSGV